MPPSLPLITVVSGKYTDTLPPVETHKIEQIQIQMDLKVGQQRGWRPWLVLSSWDQMDSWRCFGLRASPCHVTGLFLLLCLLRGWSLFLHYCNMHLWSPLFLHFRCFTFGLRPFLGQFTAWPYHTFFLTSHIKPHHTVPYLEFFT